MAITLQEVVASIEIAETEVITCVEQEWVLPERSGEQWLFDEADVARLSLIRDLRHDMAINDEAVPLVLRLLDQIYGLREALGEIQEAVRELPDEHRRALETRLREVMETHGQGT
jgi:chaperone modulatory protein CbpM